MKSKPGKKNKVERVKTAGNEDGDAVEGKSRVQRKRTKQLRFLTKLQDGQRTLSASKTIVKKQKRVRQKSAKVLGSISSLADSLPSKEEIMASAQTLKRKKIPQKSRQHAVVKETKQLMAVLAHPEFQTNPFLAIQKHLINTIPAGDLPIQKHDQGKKKRSRLTKKRTSVEPMDV